MKYSPDDYVAKITKTFYIHKIFFLFLHENMFWMLNRRNWVVLLMSTHKVCFHGKIIKYWYFSVEKSTFSGAILNYCNTSALSRAMVEFSRMGCNQMLPYYLKYWDT